MTLAAYRRRKGGSSMNIYVAPSWRNVWQPGVVKLLCACGHAVYDVREARPHGAGELDWSAIDVAWPSWLPQHYRAALVHPLAERAFASDAGASLANAARPKAKGSPRDGLA